MENGIFNQPVCFAIRSETLPLFHEPVSVPSHEAPGTTPSDRKAARLFDPAATAEMFPAQPVASMHGKQAALNANESYLWFGAIRQGSKWRCVCKLRMPARTCQHSAEGMMHAYGRKFGHVLFETQLKQKNIIPPDPALHEDQCNWQRYWQWKYDSVGENVRELIREQAARDGVIL